MKRIIITLLAVLVFFSVMAAGQKQLDRRMYDIHQGKETGMSEAITQLKQNRIEWVNGDRRIIP